MLHASRTRFVSGIAAATLFAGMFPLAFGASAATAAEANTAPSVRAGSLDVARWDDQLVGESKPALSWIVEDVDRAERQTAFQIEVRSAADTVVWNSGKVADTASALRGYGGPALGSGTDYTWRVKVWDAHDSASPWSAPAAFHTGLLSLDDWDASWLAVPNKQRARVEFSAQPAGSKAYLYIAAQGGYQARINGKRVSDEELGSTWTDFGQRTLYRGVDVTDLLRSGDNALGVTVGGTQAQEGAAAINLVAQLELVGADGTRTTLVSTKSGWRTGPSPITRLDPYRGESVDGRLEAAGWDKSGFEDTGWTPSTIVAPVVGAPQLSTAEGAVASAKDDVGCCGWSAVTLNDGIVVSRPAKDHPQGYHSTTSGSATTEKWAQVDLGKRHDLGSVELYPVDPTNDPTSGYAGMGFPVRYRVETSNDPSFANPEMLIDRTSADQANPGKAPVVLPVSAAGRYVRVTATKLRQTGATYDFRLAELLVRGTTDNPGWGLTALEPDPTPPMRVVKTVAPVKTTQPSTGVQVFDFGQNFSGWVQLSANAPSGTKARIYLGEILTGAGRVTTANLDFESGEAPRQDYAYTFAGTGTETWEPQFTYSGFRYAEISGLPAGTQVTAKARVVHTDLKKSSTLDLDDPTLQGISQAVERTQLNAVHGVPEDTPTREKKGWTGDVISTVSSIMSAFDSDTFFRKYLRDVQTSLYANGGVPSVVPARGFGATYKVDPAWGAAYPVMVWTHYLNEGDKSLLAEHYDNLAGWIDYLGTIADADHVITRPETSWGSDWLGIEATPPALFQTGHYLRGTQILADVARALGHDADATRYDGLATTIGAGINKRFLSIEKASYANDTQFANAFPLLLGIVPKNLEDRVLDNLIASIRDHGNHLTSGFVGTQPIIQALHKYGRDDVVLDTAERDDFPSLGYMVMNGPGTIWETWDKRESPTGSSSKDHPALGGGVEEWFYQGLAGIKALEPGYRRISLTVPDVPGHEHAAATVETSLGTVSSDWTRSGADLSYQVGVPVGATADVVLPAATAYAVSESGLLLADVDGVKDVSAADGTVTVTVGSGHYNFAVTAANTLLGAIADDLDALKAHAGELDQSGDLSTGDREQIDAAAQAARDDVSAALVASLNGNESAVRLAVASALSDVRTLRSWIAGSGISATVKADLDRRVGAIEAKLLNGLTASMGISVALPPVNGSTLPGGTINGTVEVTNESSVPLTALDATITVKGWGKATAAATSIPVGGSLQLPVSFAVPKQADPGGVDADLALTLVSAGETFTVTATTPDWASVGSGLTIGTVTSEIDGTDPNDHATVTVPVSNTGTVAVRAHVRLGLPTGWRSVPSTDVVIPAKKEVAVAVPVIVPLDRVSGASVPVDVDVRRAGASLATGKATLTFDLARPPVGPALIDHVDFGDTPSENAHGLQTSPSSGTNTEAGLTRRYSNSGTPGSWFSAEVRVPAGKPFVLRNVDTYFSANTKKYNIYVDDVLVRNHLLPRAESGAGFKVYDVLVDNPAVLANDGTVRVRFEYPLGTSAQDGFFDPSIADTYVVAVPADTRAPETVGVVTGGTEGENGWYRSDATVSVEAADNRDPSPVVETSQGGVWSAYTGAITFTGDGKRELGHRATDAAGNVSAARSVPVWIDAAAPVTTLAVTPGAGAEGVDQATLTFKAADATSGVASTLYRIDGGAWGTVGSKPIKIQGFGQYVVEFASTDVAGNPEVLRRETVSLADVDVVTALVAPQVKGTARLGSTLTATNGSWNTKGLSFGRQWLRNGSAIKGATGSSYRIVAADIGTRLSVRVTATKAGKAPGVRTSSGTSPVAKAASRTKVSVNKSKVKKGKAVKVSVVVTANPKATGKVSVRVDGKIVKRLTLRHGKASVTVRIGKAGKHRITAAYQGSATVAASSAATRTVKVVR